MQIDGDWIKNSNTHSNSMGIIRQRPKQKIIKTQKKEQKNVKWKDISEHQNGTQVNTKQSIRKTVNAVKINQK